MSLKFVDDSTGLVIEEGRSYRLRAAYQENGIQKDFVSIDDLFKELREVLTEDRVMPLEIIIETWSHGKKV